MSGALESRRRLLVAAAVSVMVLSAAFVLRLVTAAAVQPAEGQSTSLVESGARRPTCQPRGLLWSADHETATLGEWASAGGGGTFNSGSGEARASRDYARSGAWSAKMTITGAGGTRLFRWAESRRQNKAYYSAWFYFPRAYTTPAGWWNVFQFKSRTDDANDPFWIINVRGETDGTMFLSVDDWMQARTHRQRAVPLPTHRWVHIEAYLDQSDDGRGRLTLWQDGRELFDLVGITTRYPDGTNEWSVNNYSDHVAPNPVVLYVDDAAISTERVGGAAGCLGHSSTPPLIGAHPLQQPRRGRANG